MKDAFHFSVGDILYEYSHEYFAVIHYEIDQIIPKRETNNTEVSYRLKQFVSDAISVSQPRYYYVYCTETQLKNDFYLTREEAEATRRR